MSHIERKIREKEALRNKILQAAIALAGINGWHSVTIRDIADSIEYTPPIVYEYFESKEALFHEIILWGTRKLYTDYTEAMAKESNRKKLLRTFARIYFKFAFSNTETYELLTSLEHPTPDEEIGQIFKLTMAIFEQIIGKNRNEAGVLTLHWISLQNGVLSFMLKVHDFPPGHTYNKEKLYLHIIDQFLASLP